MEHTLFHLATVGQGTQPPGTVVGLSYRQIETIGIVLGAFDAWLRGGQGGLRRLRLRSGYGKNWGYPTW